MKVKCPLHENFNSQVQSVGEPLWRLDELWKVADKFGKKIGMIIDLTDTDRYYQSEDVKERDVKHYKLQLNIHRPDGLNFSKIHKMGEKIASFHQDSPDKIVAVHW